MRLDDDTASIGGGSGVRPAAVVFAGKGESRWSAMPWLGAPAVPVAGASHQQRTGTGHSARAPYAPATELAAELVLNGVRRTAARGWPGWPRAATELEERGYHRMGTAVRQVQAGDRGLSAALGMLKLLTLARDAA